MTTHVCDVSLSAETVQASYSGALRFVQATSRDGVRLRFPLSWLRPYVSHSGVHGTFAITIDTDHKLRALQCLATAQRSDPNAGRARPRP